MMTAKIFFIIISVLIPLISFPNGGPVDYSHFRKTGNLRLLRKADVSLIKENLSIKIVGDFSEIEVEYALQNNGEKQKIQYGFPIDAYETSWGYGNVNPIFSRHYDIVEYFKILENDNELKTTFWVVDSVYKAMPVDLNEGSYRSKDSCFILRKWYSTTIEFLKGETKTIKVLYKVKNTLRDKVPGFCFIHRFTDRFFTYHLTPSSNWGNGIVNEFNLKIDLSAIVSEGADVNVGGINELKHDENIYSYSSKDYDLKKSDRINIRYNYSHIGLSGFIKKYELPGSLIKSIRNSTNDKSMNNLIDKSHMTTWSGKQHDWIEIEFNKIEKGNEYVMPIGILALNGDYSSKENFDKSGKIKTLQVIINDSIIFNTAPWEGENGSRIVFLEKPYFRNVNENSFNGLATIVADGLGFWIKSKFIRKIRIRILTVDNSESNEFTLSEIYFVGKQ